MIKTIKLFKWSLYWLLYKFGFVYVLLKLYHWCDTAPKLHSNPRTAGGRRVCHRSGVVGLFHRPKMFETMRIPSLHGPRAK